MQILYGVVGEGMGHATRSAVALSHLAEAGHPLRVVVSGRAHRFLTERLKSYPNVTVDEIHGLTLRYFGNRLDRTGSLLWNLRKAPKGIRQNVKVYRKVAEDGFKPNLVVSDFESWAGFYALRHGLPVVSIDNMQIIHRCRHDKAVTKGDGFDFRLARLAVKIKLPGAYHYLVTSFFFPPIRRPRTTLVPPVLRPEVISAQRQPGSHVLVYLRAPDIAEIRAILTRLPHRFRVYGADREETDGNLSFRPFSESAFLEDFRTARAVIGGGGFSLMSEAVSLHVPMLSVPIEGQYEQELNARYLARCGYGAWARTLNEKAIEDFLERTDTFARNLEAYERRDNSMLLACLDEIIERCEQGKKRPKRLKSPALGKWEKP